MDNAITRFLAILLFTVNAWSASWYADNAASGADTGLSWTDAWNNLSNITWGSFAAGDTLYISGGTTGKVYTISDDSFVPMFNTQSLTGATNNPINLKVGQDAGHDGLVIFNCRSTNYVRVTGFFLNMDGQVNNDGQIHWKIANGYLGDAGNDHALLQAIGDYLNFSYLWFDSSANSFYLSGGGTGGSIRNCKFSNTYCFDGASSAISLLAQNPSQQQYDLYIVESNNVELLSALDGSGIGADGVEACQGCTIRYNTFKNVYSAATLTSGHCDFCQLGATYCKVYGNNFLNISDSAVDLGQDQLLPGYNYLLGNLQVYNNLFWSTYNSGGPSGVRVYDNTSNNLIAFTNILIAANTFADLSFSNNTLRSSAISFGHPYTYPKFVNVQILDNIFVNCGSAASGAINTEPIVNTNAVLADLGIDYNLFFAGSNGNTSIVFTNAVLGAETNQVHPFTNMPAFVSYLAGSTNNDFRLTNAEGPGTNLTALFTTDILKATRPASGGWDVGAYEFFPPAPGPVIPISININILNIGNIRFGQ